MNSVINCVIETRTTDGYMIAVAPAFQAETMEEALRKGEEILKAFSPLPYYFLCNGNIVPLHLPA